MKHTADIGEELHRQRLVEAHFGAQLVDGLLRRQRSEHHWRGIAGDQFQEEESDRHYAEELGNGEEQARCDIGDDLHDVFPATKVRHARREGLARSRGLEKAMMDAPMRPSPKTVSDSASPGKIDGHHWPVTTFGSRWRSSIPIPASGRARPRR